MSIHPLELNPKLDREAMASSFKASGRLQIRDLLTRSSAEALHDILLNQTPYGMAVQAADDGPHFFPPSHLRQMPPERRQAMGVNVGKAVGAGDYGFLYASYPMLRAYQEKWNVGGAHDVVLEHLNSEPFLRLMREVTGIEDLIKGDGQATLFGPNQFLASHDDSHVAEGWRVAYVLNMTKVEWRPDFGGYLLFLNEDGDIEQGFRPRFNALNLFAVPQKHCVSYVPPFAPMGRFAITGWFRDR